MYVWPIVWVYGTEYGWMVTRVHLGEKNGTWFELAPNQMRGWLWFGLNPERLGGHRLRAIIQVNIIFVYDVCLSETYSTRRV